MLPLPFLRAGYLTAPVAATLGGPGEAWRREWFVLDHASLRSASAMESSLSTAGAAGGLATSGLQLRIGHAVGEVPLVIPLTSIVAVRRCAEAGGLGGRCRRAVAHTDTPYSFDTRRRDSAVLTRPFVSGAQDVSEVTTLHTAAA